MKHKPHFRLSLLAVAFFALGATAPAHAFTIDALEDVPYTDIWAEDPAPQGSGWGVNFAQSEDFIYATFFVYDSNGAPKWYAGELNKSTSSGLSYVGNLYQVASAPAPNMFSPSNTQVNRVGAARFTPKTPTKGALFVQLDGSAALEKDIQRLTLTEPTIGTDGAYASFASRITYSLSTDGTHSSYSRMSLQLPLSFKHTGDNLTLGFEYPKGSDCTISGTTSVEGSFYVLKNAAYRCTSSGAVSRNTTADLYLRFNKKRGLEGYWLSEEMTGNTRSVQEFRFSATSQPQNYTPR
jgi:hypothetical protein